MIFSVGDVIHIDAPVAGKKKYHICLGQNEVAVTLCLFLNSKNKYANDVVFECSAFPMIPSSSTGLSVVSLSLVPRYSDEKLSLYNAKLLGVISKDVAKKLLQACEGFSPLTKPEKVFAVQALRTFLSN